MATFEFFMNHRYRFLRAAARFRSTHFLSFRFVIRGMAFICIKSNRPRIRFFDHVIVLMVGPPARWYNEQSHNYHGE